MTKKTKKLLVIGGVVGVGYLLYRRSQQPPMAVAPPPTTGSWGDAIIDWAKNLAKGRLSGDMTDTRAKTTAEQLAARKRSQSPDVLEGYFYV